MAKKIDNGGAYALKGFAFQDACIAYVIIRKIDDTEARIFVEAFDDCYILENSQKTFFQMKDIQNFSIAKLIENQPKGKISILEKQYELGTDSDFFVVAVSNLIKKDRLNVEATQHPYLENTYTYADTAKDLIRAKNVEALKLENSRLHISQMQGNPAHDTRLLLGLLLQSGLASDTGTAQAELNELIRIIQTKSTIVIHHESELHQKEVILSEVKDLFTSPSRVELAREFLSRCVDNLAKRTQIEKKLSERHLYRAAIADLKKFMLIELDLTQQTELDILNATLSYIKEANIAPNASSLLHCALAADAYVRAVETL